jgi:hypothetical protein
MKKRVVGGINTEEYAFVVDTKREKSLIHI